MNVSAWVTRFFVLMLVGCSGAESAAGGDDLAGAPAADLAHRPGEDLAGQPAMDLSVALDLAASQSGSLKGTITGFPLTVTVPGLDVTRLPVLDVYWLENGADWYSDGEWCATMLGSSNSTHPFSAQAGGVTLLQSYCTAAATQYQIATRPAKVSLQHAISSFPVTISDPSITVAPLPSLSVFLSDDGTSWYREEQSCAQVYGTATIAPSHLITSGQLQLPQNYCTAGAKFYQVAVRPSAHVLQGNIAAWPVTLSDSALSTNALPNVSVFWSDDGASWYQRYERCAQGGGVARSFVIHDGQIVLQQNFCTASAKHYQVVIDDQ